MAGRFGGRVCLIDDSKRPQSSNQALHLDISVVQPMFVVRQSAISDLRLAELSLYDHSLVQAHDGPAQIVVR